MEEAKTTSPINPQILRHGLSYQNYFDMVSKLVEQGLTTGENQSDFLAEYTQLNLQRMRRLNKTTMVVKELRDALDGLRHSQLWVVLTEGWCGDAAQLVPVLAKIAECSHKVGLKLLLRDEHEEIMDAFLTNGSRSIPKLIALEPRSLKVLGSWGPRPKEAQEMVMAYKADPKGVAKEEFYEQLHGWYAKDKTLSSQKELAAKVKEWDAAQEH